ncbi:hypothetical protein HanRHA438_Chr08g0365331 [Helianthus annuus]|nr:hypothetical protein HanRHA438_Chr08g0365331 [Helianthus annuus]
MPSHAYIRTFKSFKWHDPSLSPHQKLFLKKIWRYKGFTPKRKNSFDRIKSYSRSSSMSLSLHTHIHRGETFSCNLTL